MIHAIYLQFDGQSRVFATTLEDGIARIYPLSVWRQNEIMCAHVDPSIAEDVFLIAHLYGVDSPIDPYGRVRLGQELRKRLRIDGQRLVLMCFANRINAFTLAAFEARKQMALHQLAQKLRSLERLGMR